MGIKTQIKLLLLLSLMVVLFLFLYWSIHNIEKQKEEALLNNRKHDLEFLFKRVVQLKSTPLETHVYFEYSLWDEMVNFIQNGNQNWVKEQIGSALETYHLDAAWIYDPRFNLKFTQNTLKNSGSLDMPVPPQDLPKLFSHGYHCHFFVSTPLGLMEIFGSAVHPSGDTDRKTPIRGFYFVGHYWDKRYLEDISELTESNVTLSPINSVNLPVKMFTSDKNLIVFSEPLKDFEDNPVMLVTVKNTSQYVQLYEESYKQGMNLFIFYSVGIVFLLTVFLFLWVSLPLSSIASSLTQQNPFKVNKLRKQKTEFGYIAQLITQFFEQKEILLQEIKDRKLVQEELLKTSSALEAIFKAFPDIYFHLDQDGKVLTYHTGCSTELFVPSNKIVGKYIQEVFPPDIGNLFDVNIKKVLQQGEILGFEYWITMPQGEQAYEARILPIMKNQLITIIRNVTQRKRLEEALHELSIIDDLTGLYNRRGLNKMAEQLLKTVKRLQKHLILSYLDLDGMKNINDSFGHTEGDKALITLANLFKATFRESDIIARIGGDEFVVMAIVAEIEDGVKMEARFQQKLKEFNAKKILTYPLEVSLGFSVYDPEKEFTLEDLLHTADQMMYEKKKQKRCT